MTSMAVIDRLLAMGVDTNHELTQKRPYGTGGGRFEQYDRRGGTGPLMIAVMNNDHEAMQRLLAHDAEVDLRNVFEMTPLMIAVGMSGTGRAGGGGGGGPAADPARALKTIELLLDAGANLDAQVVGSQKRTAKLVSYVQGRNDQEGKTALMHAAEIGNDRVAKLLLDRGANPALRDAAGKSALDIARTVPPVGDETEQQKQARLRVEAGRKAMVPLIEAAMARSGGGTPGGAR